MSAKSQSVVQPVWRFVAGFFNLLYKLFKYLGRTRRGFVLTVSVSVAVLGIAFFTITLGKDHGWAVFLFDYSSKSYFPFPITIQNGLYILFFFGLGDLLVRWNAAEKEIGFVNESFLPEDDQTVLQLHELGPIRRKVAKEFDSDSGFLPYLINLSILQFQASRSVDQTVSVLNSSLELISHRVDLRYSTIRYIVWAIPTVGFIGTVVGISGALRPEYINQENIDITSVSASLGIAFYTTIIALILSAILVLAYHVVQKHEESGVNLAGDYCLKNLINRLYVGDDG